MVLMVFPRPIRHWGGGGGIFVPPTINGEDKVLMGGGDHEGEHRR